MNKFFSLVVLVFVAVQLKAVSIEDYYASASGLSGEELKSELHNIISAGQVVLSYAEVWGALKITDEDPDNSDNVILLYTGWSYPKTVSGGDASDWNREHTWAKSMGDFGTSNGPGTDIHHLRPTDVTVNSARGNLYFDDGGTEYVDGSRYDGGSGSTGCLRDGDSWEPRDEVKGDVARMLFYMATRYELEDGYDLELAEYSSATGLHGKLSTLLKWHQEDPVDEWEQNRNEKIYGIQKNRNPFIDHPEYVELIWEADVAGSDDTGEYTILFSEDFESATLNNMTHYSVVGNNQYWYDSSTSGNYYAKMSGYDGSYNQNEDWLINKKAIDLSGYTQLSLSFLTMMEVYQGETEFSVLISSDYNGSSDPNLYSWEDVTSQALLSTGSYNAVNSGSIDLTTYENKSIYIAFKFVCTDQGSNTWNVDDIVIKGLKSTAIEENNLDLELVLFPNPASEKFKISGIPANQRVSLQIINQSGIVTQYSENINSNSEIYTRDLNPGLYLVKVELETGKQLIQKLIVQ